MITGAINFYKDNTSTLILTGANSYTGSTNIIGGGLTLQDSGTMASTNINVNGATLTHQRRRPVEQQPAHQLPAPC